MNPDGGAGVYGGTPLRELERFGIPERGIRIFAKLEMFNPTASIKDRIASFIVAEAEKEGRLKPGSTIVESSSGNTGAALARVGAAKGYRVIVTVPDRSSPAKIAQIRGYGAEAVLCPASAALGSPDHYISRARAIADSIPGAFLAGQYHNLQNPRAHYASTGPEIWEQTGGRIDYLIACASSGGTVSGTGRFLKEKNPSVRVIVPDPEGSVYYDHFYNGGTAPPPSSSAGPVRPSRIEGAGKNFVCGCADFSVVDEVIRFTDEEALAAARELERHEGISAGGTSGAALHTAVRLAARLTGPARIVAIFPDSGSKYVL